MLHPHSINHPKFLSSATDTLFYRSREPDSTDTHTHIYITDKSSNWKEPVQINYNKPPNRIKIWYFPTDLSFQQLQSHPKRNWKPNISDNPLKLHTFTEIEPDKPHQPAYQDQILSQGLKPVCEIGVNMGPEGVNQGLVISVPVAGWVLSLSDHSDGR